MNDARLPQMETWRFIDSGYRDGYENMAIDLALTESYRGTPTLRVYGWKPPAISLGFHQSLLDLDLTRCAEDGIDVVYRPTGGRAVLHAAEITYAVVLGPQSALYDQRILPVYERISQGILAALQQLYIPIAFERAGKNPQNYSQGELGSLCYAASVKYEIGHAGRKLIGSAQRRFGDVVLQHGSILMGQEHLKLVDYLSRQDAQWQRTAKKMMLQKTVCLNDLSPAPLTYEQLALALRAGFAWQWNLNLLEDGLTAEERDKTRRLADALRREIEQGSPRET